MDSTMMYLHVKKIGNASVDPVKNLLLVDIGFTDLPNRGWKIVRLAHPPPTSLVMNCPIDPNQPKSNRMT